MPILHYILNSPILWVVRWYITTFYSTFILVELDVTIPYIFNKPLDNFCHKGFLMSFIGFLDLCMSSNKTVDELVEYLQDNPSGRSIRTNCAFAILAICSRGLIVCGIIYLLLGVCGWNGERRRMVLRSKNMTSV